MDGIIPAYAGNTPRHGSSPACRRDHPRVCGEHRWVRRVACRRPGSSPRMRGTPRALIELNEREGIIPAYAGNTSALQSTLERVEDHPRVCGEHAAMGTDSCAIWGSSPRMRGTPHKIPIGDGGYGIIPAYAGNTLFFPDKRKGVNRDHPRVCGEHTAIIHPLTHGRGSSPRMRGTPLTVCHSTPFTGIIPAYAGNTLPRVCSIL